LRLADSLYVGPRGPVSPDISMLTLFHHPFCPHSRFIRLALGETGLAADLIEERAGAAGRIPYAQRRRHDAGAGR
jgi:hypothetical protein